ncbi:hypothetical protein P5673_026866 [Acropora cervicornis]|uniref:Uncharacterized protein n=1 Tax=Acropora cervicornis TaxID=6130 RepID=A0AAD9PZY3_ACRCE|nr:hypothetical protein P5673_026866 [Acropora cervicornis]
MRLMFQSERESISAWERRVVERAKYCEYENFEDQAWRDRFIAGLVDENLSGKLNTIGHRDKDDTASTTNTLAVDDLRTMCPAGFDIHGPIKLSSASLRGGGVIKPVGQAELVCETQGKFHTLQFQLLNKDVMGSQPPLLSGSDCVRLGLIDIGRSTCSLDRNKPKGGSSSSRKSGMRWMCPMCLCLAEN